MVKAGKHACRLPFTVFLLLDRDWPRQLSHHRFSLSVSGGVSNGHFSWPSTGPRGFTWMLQFVLQPDASDAAEISVSLSDRR